MHLKTIEQLNNGKQLFIFYANDKGRGKNNCTIQLVDKNQKRKLTAKDTTIVLKEVYTSSWKGDINFSKNVQKLLGIRDIDLMRYKQIKRFDDQVRRRFKDSAELNFDLLWMRIDKVQECNSGFVTKDQLKKFAEKIYMQAWADRYQVEWD